MTRTELEEVLPWRVERRQQERGAVKNALGHLRDKKRLGLPVNAGDEEVLLGDERIWIDLWVFFGLVEAGKHLEAGGLLPANGAGPAPLQEDLPIPDRWNETFALFSEQKQEVLDAVEARSGRNKMMLATRERLLARSLVPGVGRELPIGEARSAIDPIGFPWRNVRPRGKLERSPLPKELAKVLSDPARSSPKHLVVVGGHGAGKTLAAISTYLRLTDSVEEVKTAVESRPVFYIDGQNDVPAPMATEGWLEQRLNDAEALDHGRPILIMSHGDSFFGRDDASANEILNWPLFRESDVLLCCSEAFYEDELKFMEHLDDVFRLERWEARDQKVFTGALFRKQTWRLFESWRDEDETGARKLLCSAPLHLSFVLPLIEEGGDAIASISTHWHLFDQLARLRLDASHLSRKKDKLLGELAAMAHHFHVPGTKDHAIAFNRKELEDFLYELSPKKVEWRRAILTYQTLLVAPPVAHIDYRFEHPQWGQFFVALHLSETLKTKRRSEPVVKAFAKRFSEEALRLCEEMVIEDLGRHQGWVLGSLRGALDEVETQEDLTASQLKAAKEQVLRLQAAVLPHAE
jgi:hypothetical protein